MVVLNLFNSYPGESQLNKISGISSYALYGAANINLNQPASYLPEGEIIYCKKCRYFKEHLDGGTSCGNLRGGLVDPSENDCCNFGLPRNNCL